MDSALDFKLQNKHLNNHQTLFAAAQCFDSESPVKYEQRWI